MSVRLTNNPRDMFHLSECLLKYNFFADIAHHVTYKMLLKIMIFLHLTDRWQKSLNAISAKEKQEGKKLKKQGRKMLLAFQWAAFVVDCWWATTEPKRRRSIVGLILVIITDWIMAFDLGGYNGTRKLIMDIPMNVCKNKLAIASWTLGVF